MLAIKRRSFVEMAYRDTKEFFTLEEYLASNPSPKPHAFIIGSPPAFHGGTLPGADTEMKISKAFPTVAMFVEKPISTSTVADVFACSEYLKNQNHVVSVGYMFRYLKVVQKAKDLLVENRLIVSAISARYASCYPPITKAFWWDKDLSYAKNARNLFS